MKRTSHNLTHNVLGQGFAEYAIILLFVGLSAMITVTIMDPALGVVFSRISRSEPISPPELAEYSAQSTSTPRPTATSTPDGLPTVAPTNTPIPTATMTATPLPAASCGTVLEAETAVLSGFMQLNTDRDPTASGGRYAYVPDGSGDNYAGPNGDAITFTFDVTTAETYRFIGYIYAEDATSDSFHVEIDGISYQWDLDETGAFTSQYVNDLDGSGSDPVEVSLSAGTHTLTVSLREDGARLDRIVLECTSAPLNPTPTPDPTAICGQSFEAELGTLSGSMFVGNDGNASGGQYVYATGGPDFNGPNSNSLSIEFTVVEAGTFEILGNVYATNGSHDSFWVTLDGVQALWDTQNNTTYQGDYISNRNGADPMSYNLTPGTYSLVFSLREANTRLDKVTIMCAGAASPTADFLMEADNLCLTAASTTQSSTSHSGVASRACDGDRDGLYSSGSVTHTQSETNPWWEVDLGRVNVLQQIKIFNRTDCCTSRLSNFYVIVSDDPILSTDLTTALNQPGVDSFYFDGDVDALAYAFSQQSGRYIRIQTTGSDPLSLAEVEIYGSREVPDNCSAVIDMFYIIDESGSMDYSMTGAASRMAASRSAITSVNDAMVASGLPHRVGAVSFRGGNYYGVIGGYGRYEVRNTTYPVTTDIDEFTNTTLPAIDPSGRTPTGPAINDARSAMIDAWDPLRIPVVILITDGAPNIARDNIGYSASAASNIDVFDTNGDPYPLSTISTFGNLLVSTGLLRQGNILVDVLSSTQELMRSLPNATLHTVGLGNVGASEFNPSLLQYAADIGGGNYYEATSAAALNTALTEIYNSVPSCEVDS